MVRFYYVPNILEDKGRIERFYPAGRRVVDYVRDFCREQKIPFSRDKYRIIVDGKVESNLTKQVKDGQEIILVVEIKEPFSLIATAGSILAAAASYLGWAGIWVKIGLALMIGGSIGAYLAYKPKKPSFGTIGGDAFESSPTYGWDGIQMTRDVGIPIPIVYGEHRIGGNLINVYIDEEVQYDTVWVDDNGTNVTASGYENQFRTSQTEVYGIKFEITPIRAVTYYGSGGAEGYKYVDHRYESGDVKSPGRYWYPAFKIYYKKATDTDWTYWGKVGGFFREHSKYGGYAPGVNQAGNYVVQINELEAAQYDVRIVLDTSGFNASYMPPSDTQYWSNMDVKVKQPSQNLPEKQYLNMLVALCEGPIEEIRDIKINGNPIENFMEGENRVEYFIRLGEASQEPVPYFDDLHDLHTINASLTKDNPYTYTTEGTDIEKFAVHLIFPNGIFMQDQSSGQIKPWSVSFKIEYRQTGATDWTNAGTYTVSKKSRSQVRRKIIIELPSAGQYDIRVTRTSDDSDFYHQGDAKLLYIDEVKSGKLSYPYTALLGIRALATEQLSGGLPNVTCVVKGRKVKVPKVLYGTEELEYDEYYWDGSNYKRFSDDATCTVDGYTTKWTANPVWCLYDLLTNTRYGIGEFIPESKLDLDKFNEMARYCDELVPSGIASGVKEKRFRLDVVIDSEARVPDLIAQLCQTFRAFAFYSAGLIVPRINKAESAVQLFTMGNIIEKSYTQRYASLKEIPTVVEVSFMDRDKDYEREMIEVADETALANGEPIRKRRLDLIGVTRLSQAIREAKYVLRLAKNCTRMISFKAGIDAMVAQVGDVIYFQHDVPQWGYGGRVVAATNSPATITLDREITIEAGYTYKVLVRKADDTFEEKTVTNTEGTYTTLNVDSDWASLPQKYDLYVVGKQNIYKKPFRILNIQKEATGEVNISALEYNEDVYDDSEEIVLPDINYSDLHTDIPLVSNLELTERLVKLKDGTIENAIDVWFTKPSIGQNWFKKYARAKIYISEDDGKSWIYKGETAGEHFEILGGVKDGLTYKIAVTSVCDNGEESLIDNSPQEQITIQGKTAPPEDVTGFAVNFYTDKLIFTWNHVSDIDLKGYEIRELPSADADWGMGTIIATAITENRYELATFTAGTKYYAIKAIDTSGNYSQNMATDSIYISSVPEKNIVLERGLDLSKGTLSGSAERCWMKGYSEDYYRIGLSILTSEKWDEGTWDDGTCWDTPVETSEATYISEVIDLGKSYKCSINLEIGLANVQGGQLTIYIAYSDSDPDPSNFVSFAQGEFTGRYFKFKFVFKTNNENYGVDIYKIRVIFDVPDKTQEGIDVAVAGTDWTQIDLSDFTEVRTLIVSSRNGAYVPETDESGLPSYFKVRLLDPANSMAQVAGKINYFAKGY